jgi:NAD(P)-dependent dehydrogenase (short-subunit alcohol dehydrogenase family)
MTVSPATPHVDPRDAASHRFGLTPERWAALEGKAVWITGAGTGFGRCFAVALAAAGAVPVLSGRRREKLEETRAEINALGLPGERAVAIPVDITDAESVARAAREIDDRIGGLDGLINNAGTFVTNLGSWPLAESSPADWDRQLDLNLRGQWLVTRAALPLLETRGAIKTVFVSSEAGWAFTPSAGLYNVSKAAINNLAASFAAECAARCADLDVQINTINPGEARTEMNQGSTESPYIAVSITLMLLSHPPGGPNGRFFVWDGRHVAFCYAPAWESALQ